MFENLSSEWVYCLILLFYLIGIWTGWKACKLMTMAKEADARDAMVRTVYRPNRDY